MDELLGHLVLGGPVLWVLIALSVLSITVILAKVLQLMPVRRGGARRTEAAARWRAGDGAAAQAALAAGGTPADRLMLRGLQGLADGLPQDMIEADLTRAGNAEVAGLSSGLRLLELIAMAAPLIGLLGTVLGMIEAFQDLEMAQGSANAAVLAGGIWEALLTTAGGLIVAIPAAVGAGLLAARVDLAAAEMEASVGELMRADHVRRSGA